MEEGSMRIDANVSVRRTGDPFGTRCEIKNLNSLRSLVRAIDYESLRQIELIVDGGTVRQETRHWDENLGETSTMRTKEEAEDYRYFREPDLVDLVPDDAWQARVRSSLGPMPAQRRAELVARITDPTPAMLDAVEVVVDLGLDPWVTAAIDALADPGLSVARAANELAANVDGLVNLTPEAFTATVLMERRGELSATQAKTVLGELLERGGDPSAIAAAKGFEQLSSNEIGTMVEQLIEEHPGEWSRFKEGDEKLAQFFIGQVMKLTKGQANGKAVIAELHARR
jgi:aspartyl-tRNA(Asn)/glutamyl-tRNA(Gln) amidotransferase subunit B